MLTYNQVYRQYISKSTYFVDNDLESKISTSKELMLCNYLYYSNKNLIDYKKDIQVLNEVIDKIFAFNENSFCTIKRDADEISNKIHELFSEALVIALLNNTNINVSKEKFNEQKIKIWRNVENYSEFFVSTTNLENVEKRVNVLKKILSGEEI